MTEGAAAGNIASGIMRCEQREGNELSEPNDRKLSRKELDKLEAEMIMRPFERREF